MKYPEKLKLVRESLNLTQSELGEKLEVSGRTILNWENGKTTMPKHRMAAAEALVEKQKVRIDFVKISDFMEIRGLTRGMFAKRAGVTEKELEDWESDGYVSESKLDTLESIIGEGIEVKSRSFQNLLTIPFYDIDVTAGNISSFSNNVGDPTEQYFMPAFQDCTAIFPIFGESMSPRYRSGDRLIVKEYPHFREYIQYGEVYVIFTSNDERMIKVIKKCEKPDYLLLSSLNSDYDDFEIPASVVNKLYMVKGKLSIDN
jgi:transcriptional regulator with XRE-family HTH domain